MLIKELKRPKQSAFSQWLIIGDFNLIYKYQDKNNGRLNRGLMNRFRRALNHMDDKEVEMVGRRFTWSNQLASPTMTRIDRVFFTTVMEDIYNNLILQSLSSSMSDHCPLILMPIHTPLIHPVFRFESHWPTTPVFHECVLHTSTKAIPHNQNPMSVLHIKLSRTAKDLKKWSKAQIPHTKIAMAIYREVINQLEKVQERRTITTSKHNLIKLLKARILGLAAIQSRGRQISRITRLTHGDANKFLFHIMANQRRKKKLHPLSTL
jgi:hypothetical protein